MERTESVGPTGRRSSGPTGRGSSGLSEWGSSGSTEAEPLITGYLGAWSDLWRAVDALPAEAFAGPSGCRGWLVRDLVCHLVIDVQDVLITLASPAGTSVDASVEESTETPVGTSTDTAPPHPVDGAGYWSIVDAPTGDDPLDALIPRLAAAYEDPALLTFHLDDLGSAAARAVRDADPDRLVETQGMVLSTGDFADAYVLEWTLHHLDLAAGAPDVPGPSAASLSRARELLMRVVAGAGDEGSGDPDAGETDAGDSASGDVVSGEVVSGDAEPMELPDPDVLRILTGRREPSADELAALPPAIARGLPYPIG